MGEIIIIAGIALVVIGPEKFPEFAKISLRAFRDFRGYWDDIKREMDSELKPVKRELQKLSKYNPEDYVENLAKAVTSIDDEEEAKTDGPVDPVSATKDAPPEQDTMPRNKQDGEPDDIPEENPARLDK
jgi:Tat protein translocase TatB subunit